MYGYMIKKTLKTILFYIIFIIVWYLLWYFMVEVFGWFKPYVMVSPLEVFRSMFSLISGSVFWNAVLTSLGRLVLGFVIAVLVSGGLAWILLTNKFFYKEIKELISGIQTLPNVCWIPFAIILCGLGDGAVIFVIVMGASFAMAVSIEGSLRNVNPIYIKAAKTMGCKKTGIVYHVMIPAALPNLISALRQGWAFSWRALMAGEMLQSSMGLGYLLTYSRENNDMPQVICIMIVLIVIGAFFEKVMFGMFENRVLRRRGLQEG